MFNLCRYATLSHVVRNFGVTRKLFASTTVLAEKRDTIDTQKPALQKPKSKLMKLLADDTNSNVLMKYF